MLASSQMPRISATRGSPYGLPAQANTTAGSFFDADAGSIFKTLRNRWRLANAEWRSDNPGVQHSNQGEDSHEAICRLG